MYENWIYRQAQISMNGVHNGNISVTLNQNYWLKIEKWNFSSSAGSLELLLHSGSNTGAKPACA